MAVSTRALPPARRNPGTPPGATLRLAPEAAALLFSAAAAALFAVWWRQIPVDPAVYGAWWERDKALLPPAWPGAAWTWLADARALALTAFIELSCLAA